MGPDDDGTVIGEAMRLVEGARRVDAGYAGSTSPLRTDQLAGLMRNSGCHVEVFPFRSSLGAMALPRYAGLYPVFVNSAADRTERVFALRHELAHVLAGDVDEPLYLADDGYTSLQERVADLFALADLVPGWWMRWISEDANRFESEVARAVTDFAEGWPSERIADRARLRIALFRACGT
jgi:hypothetical protein